MKTDNFDNKNINLIYMDNAATSWPKPPMVRDEIYNCIVNYCANPGRGSHSMSRESTKVVSKCRECVSRLINARDEKQVVFTKNCTEAINQLLYGFLSENDHVVVGPMEHNAVMRPLWDLAQTKNIDVSMLGYKELLSDPWKELYRTTNARTKLIICMLSSNVTGRIFPIFQIGEFARMKGIPFMVDAAQGLGCVDVNVERMGISMIAFPGHKSLYGPQGTGGYWIDEKIILKPMIKGGTGFNSTSKQQGMIFPHEYESGTLNVPGIAGLLGGVSYLKMINVENIRKKKDSAIRFFVGELETIRGVKLLSEKKAELNSGIVSINIGGADSRDVARQFDQEYNICVRGGMHCAPQAHRNLGTSKQGCVRFSPGLFTTRNEIEKCCLAIEKIARKTLGQRRLF